MTNDELQHRLTSALALLAVPGIGRGLYRRLVRTFGSPDKVAQKDLSSLEQVRGISRRIASAIVEKYDEKASCEAAARVVQLGWRVMFQGDADYPERLQQIDDAPPILYGLGDSQNALEHTIGIVGTRRPTGRGRLFARDLAAALARAGVTVVSGMAEGIDTAAHQGALEGGGKTIAVWGTSLDVVYPKSNRQLADRIQRSGGIYSEYPPKTHPARITFPERNRIISGLSEGVVVVEAGKRSGALITARHALEQGREVFAVPGPPGTLVSEGTNALIKQGAHLLTEAEDIFRHLPLMKGEVKARRFQRLEDLTDSEKGLVALLAEGPQQIDNLSRTLKQPIPAVMELLLALELRGAVREMSGKRFILVE